MALRTLIFGTDDLYPLLKPYYDKEVERDHLKITAYAVIEKDGSVTLLDATGRLGGGNWYLSLIL